MLYRVSVSLVALTAKIDCLSTHKRACVRTVFFKINRDVRSETGPTLLVSPNFMKVPHEFLGAQVFIFWVCAFEDPRIVPWRGRESTPGEENQEFIEHVGRSWVVMISVVQLFA